MTFAALHEEASIQWHFPLPAST